MNLLPGDIRILDQLATYTFLQSSQIAELTGRVSRAYPPTQLVNKRLRELRIAGLIRRFPLPRENDQLINQGEYVHFFTRKGAQTYSQITGEKATAPESTTNTYLPHEFLITKFHLGLVKALASHHCAITDWTQRRANLYDKFGHESINPDAFFGIEDLSKPEEERFSYYFLEVERSRQKYTAGKTSLEEKFERYLSYSKGPFQKKYEVPTFRVLTLMTTGERVQNFLERVKDTGLDKAKFLYTALPWFESDPLKWHLADGGVRLLNA